MTLDQIKKKKKATKFNLQTGYLLVKMPVQLWVTFWSACLSEAVMDVSVEVQESIVLRLEAKITAMKTLYIINFNISWQVVKRVKPFAPNNKVCGLCLQEKLSILRSAPSLNKRSEIFRHCIHRKKFLLSNLSMSTDEVSIADRNSES